MKSVRTRYLGTIHSFMYQRFVYDYSHHIADTVLAFHWNIIGCMVMLKWENTGSMKTRSLTHSESVGHFV